MSNLFVHKRYIRIRKSDSSLVTFTSTNDAITKTGPKSCYDTSSPTRSYVLADSNQTLVTTFEFNSLDEQTAFKNAVDAAIEAGGSHQPQNTTDEQMDEGCWVEHFKTEWLHKDGSVSHTAYPPLGTY